MVHPHKALTLRACVILGIGLASGAALRGVLFADGKPASAPASTTLTAAPGGRAKAQRPKASAEPPCKPTPEPGLAFHSVMLALDDAHSRQIEYAEAAGGTGGAKKLLDFQRMVESAEAMQSDVDGIIDVQSYGSKYSRRIPLVDNIYVAYYVSATGTAADGTNGTDGDWRALKVGAAGLDTVKLIGKNNHTPVNPKDVEDQSVVPIYLSEVSGLNQEPPDSFLTLTVSCKKQAEYSYSASNPETLQIYFRPALGFVPYGIANSRYYFWIPVGLLAIHQNRAGAVNFDVDPLGLAAGGKFYCGNFYLGFSPYVAMGNSTQNFTQILSSGTGAVFTSMCYGALVDIDDYMYVGFEIERNFSVPDAARGAVVIGLSSALLSGLKGKN
jgi:hypothetical protein